MALTDTQVYFGGNDISAIAGATIIDHNFNDLPQRDIKMSKLARTNKSVTTSAEYSDKEVTVQLHLLGCDRSETETVMAELKSQLRLVNGDLIVSQAGSDITFADATLNEINYSWYSNKMIITLVFVVADPIGFEEDTTVMINTVVTAAASSNPIVNTGSFDAEPIINITVTTVTDGTGQSLSVKNEETGQGITLTRTWVDGDTVEIDSDNKTVTINGTISDFTGQFPTFPPGTGSFGYTDTFTTRSVDLTAVYQRHFI